MEYVEVPQSSTRATMNDENDICSICHEFLNNEDIFTTECNHRFHRKCLLDWRNTKCHNYAPGEVFSCPICKQMLSCNDKKLFVNIEDSEIQLELFQAIKDKNLEKIKSILENNDHLKNKIYNGSDEKIPPLTPLIYALSGTSTDVEKDEIVTFLINKLNNTELMQEVNTAFINSIFTVTALSMAISTGKVESAKLLIERLEASYLNKSIRHFNDASSVFELVIKVSKRYPDYNLDSILELLINKEDFNLDIQPQPNVGVIDDIEFKIPLILAIKNGKIQITNLLIDKGAKVDKEALTEIKKKISEEKDIKVKKDYEDLKKKISSKLSITTTLRAKLSFLGGIKTRKTKRRKTRTKRKKSLKKKSLKRKRTRRR